MLLMHQKVKLCVAVQGITTPKCLIMLCEDKDIGKMFLYCFYIHVYFSEYCRLLIKEFCSGRRQQEHSQRQDIRHDRYHMGRSCLYQS